MKHNILYLSAVAATLASALAVGQGEMLVDPQAEESGIARLSNPKERLGRMLFNDTRLSEPAGQSCASCHDAKFATTDPDKWTPTSQGVNPALFGNRNTPTAMYMAFRPAFHFDEGEGLYLGGQFLDGRAATLEEQAKGPFLNLLEMANTSKQQVVDKVRSAESGGFVRLASEDGKFKVPTLRNIALTSPYMHNGYFGTLKGVVDFYNTRDTKPACPQAFLSDGQAIAKGCWPAPEEESNVNGDELGNLSLTSQEVNDIVAFMHTLTDGWLSVQGN